MATKYNYNTIINWHPEMILICQSPLTWQGFLIIPHSIYAAQDPQCPRVKLKLVVPNYPSLCNAQIQFGKQIATLRNKEFTQKVKALMQTESTVQLFLTELQSLIYKYMNYTNIETYTSYLPLSGFTQDLKAALENPSDVQLSCNGNLNTIKLSLKGVSLTLQHNDNSEIPWKVVSSDLPKTPPFDNFEKNVINLNIAMAKFKWQVELLEKAWEQLKEIDENCWVIDPLRPNKSHMFRRIHLSQSISVTITIDPLNPTVLPVIKFSGSDSEVKRQIDNVSINILNWDQKSSIIENLRMLLNMYEFPEQQDVMDDNAIIGSLECGICFYAKSDDDELPDKICNNEKCMKHYHSTCLSRWLQTRAGNEVVFDYIHGTCPHCKENISCPVKQ